MTERPLRRDPRPVMAAADDLDRLRWHVCCATCRRTGHRAGCPDCQDRDQATYSQPHPDDYPGRGRPAEDDPE